LVSLGHAARNKAQIKVRQPLPEAAFLVSSQDNPEVITQYAELIKDELNVKEVRALSAVSEAVSYELIPLPKQLGQKYKDLFPEVHEAILAMPQESSAIKLIAGENLIVKVKDEQLEILPSEVEVRIQAKSGFTVATEGATIAALVTEISEELEYEGLAREFVRNVQEARKLAGLDIADRIKLSYTCSEKLGKAILSFEDYIKTETLALILSSEVSPDVLPNTTGEFDGEQVTIWISKIEKENG